MWLNPCLVRRGLAFVVGLFVTSSAVEGGAVLYVDDDAGSGGTGLSWDAAYRFLQDALVDAAATGTVSEIRVAGGTYVPGFDDAHPNGEPSDCCETHVGIGCDNATCQATVCGSLPFCCVIGWDQNCVDLAASSCTNLCSSRTATFQLIDGVAIRGGYAGWGGGDPDERDVEAYETILSGDVLGNDAGNLVDPLDPSRDENRFHVVTGDGTGPTAVLDGFTVTGGVANDPAGFEDLGGGMHVFEGSPTVLNCTFEFNRARIGGGIHIDSAVNPPVFNPLISNCTFIGNVAASGTVGGQGGGLRCENAGPTISNCTFIDNVSIGGSVLGTGAGAGLACRLSSTPTIENCVFIGNRAEVGTRDHTGFGAGIYSENSTPTLVNCTFQQNEAIGGQYEQTGLGGGMVINIGPPPVQIRDCVFVENTARGEVFAKSGVGGGLFVVAASPIMTNCVFIGNRALGADFELSGRGGGTWSTGGSRFSGTRRSGDSPLCSAAPVAAWASARQARSWCS
jgi:hypothetical protein